MSFKSPRRGVHSIRRRMDSVLGAPGIAYLLRDEFITTRATGAVNGTAPEPGPGGNRNVVDINNKLSIAGAVLSAATGSVGGNDPRVYYDTRTRIAGRLLLAAPNVSSEGVGIGFSNSNAFLQRAGIRFRASIQADTNSGNWIDVASYSTSTAYTIAIILRTSGFYAFVKGGAFTNWTLLWSSPNQSTATLYPIINTDDNSSIYTVDFIRIPIPTWLPIPVAYDTFTRANGALGISEISGPDNQIVQARTWNNRIGTTLIAANTASASVLAGGIAIATVDTNTADVMHSAELTRVAGNVGIVVRYVDASNYVYAIHDGTNAILTKRVAGVETPVISAITAYAAGTVIRIVCEGTTFSLYYNDIKIGVTSTIADAELQNGTEQGLYSSNVGNSQDDFEVFPRGSGGEFMELDRW